MQQTCSWDIREVIISHLGYNFFSLCPKTAYTMAGPEDVKQEPGFSITSPAGRRNREVNLSQPFRCMVPPRQAHIIYFLTFITYRGMVGKIDKLFYLRYREDRVQILF